LLDQKRVLTKIAKAIEGALRPLAPGRVSAKGISAENQQCSDIVTAIAQEFGFNPILNVTATKNPTFGTLYGSADQTFITVPQSLWNILHQLARDTGNTVYVTPTKDLVFGEPGVGLATIYLSYDDFNMPDGYVPCKNMRMEHHPRKNSTFRVIVISYEPGHAQPVVGRAVYVGDNYAGAYGLQAGVASGATATKQADAAFVKLKSGVGQVALYTLHVDGLNQQQADMKAASFATELARREVLASATIDGLANILPTQIVRIGGNLIPKQFVNETFYVSEYQQTFILPTTATSRPDGGWITQLTGLNIPVEPGNDEAKIAGIKGGKQTSKTRNDRQNATPATTQAG
jgi:hypothetical protein